MTTFCLGFIGIFEEILGVGQRNNAALLASALFFLVTIIVETCFTETFTEQGPTVPSRPAERGRAQSPVAGRYHSPGSERSKRS